MKLRIISTSLTTKIIAWIQIIGGIYGIGVVSLLTIKLQEINGAILFIVLAGYSLFILSITAGSKLLNKRSLKPGLILSIFNQSLQIIQFKILGYSLIYSAGLELAIGFKDGLKFNFAMLSSEFNMAINTDDTNTIFMLNVFAILLILILIDIWTELYNKNKPKIFDEIHEDNNAIASNN